MRDESRIIHELMLGRPGDIFDRLTAEQFQSGTGRRAFEILRRAWTRNVPILSVVSQALPAGDEYVDSFLNAGDPSHYRCSVAQSMERVEYQHYAQQVARLAEDTSRVVSDQSHNIHTLQAYLDSAWTPTIKSAAHIETPTVNEVANEALADMEEARSGKVQFFGWGIDKLDELVQVRGGQIIVIAARPGAGKSALATTSIRHQLSHGFSVGLICPEMSAIDIYRRLLIQEVTSTPRAEFTAKDLDGGLADAPNSSVKAYERADAVLRGYEGRFHLCCGSKPSISEIRAYAYSWVKQRGCQTLWIDYLTDLALDDELEYHRAVERMSTQIRDLSRELNIPIYLLAQLNRGGAGEYPQLHHLAGSSKIEQDAHACLLIDRPELDKNTTVRRSYKDSHGSDVDMTGKAAIWVRKNRKGRTGSTIVEFVGPKMQFMDTRD